MSRTNEFIERIKERGSSSSFERRTFLRLHCNEAAIDAVNDYLTKQTDRPLVLTGDCGMGKDHLMYRLTYLKNLKAMHLSAEYLLNLLQSMKISIDEIDVSVLAQEYEFFRLDVAQLLQRSENPHSWNQFLMSLAKTGCKTVMTMDRFVGVNQPDNEAILAHIGPMSEHDILTLSKFYFVHEFGYEPQEDEDLRLCSENLLEQTQSCRTIAGSMKKARMIREMRDSQEES
ncbi:MAG: hypothetical protein KF681_15940 [Bdellovibrionaceae bacterium]|nr:hypothetical protein [Pseudobdellovibrionaceae bacterium]